MEQDSPHHLNEKTSIDGFNKMHRGTDFAAPMGTQLWLQGLELLKKLDGVRWRKQVVIKHNSTYQTIYAHMSKFAKGIRGGVRANKAKQLGTLAPQENPLAHIYIAKSW